MANLHQVSELLFNNEHDPRSVAYKRILVRPHIHWGRILLNILCPLLCCALLGYILTTCKMKYGILASLFLLIFYAFCRAKSLLLCLIALYQHYAPDKIRNKCRFEPSCSEYMRLSILKYGVVKGVRKGILRLRRCKPDNGGFDYP